MIKIKKEKKTKEELLEEKRLKKEQQAEKKASKKEKAPKAAKSKPQKAPKQPKPQKAPKVKKPKPTKAEKVQSKKDSMIIKNKRKAEKIRAKAASKSEKLKLKSANKAEKKQIKKEQKAEKKQFEKNLRQEIKDAKKDMPKSKARIIMIPVIVVILLAASAVFLHIQGIGPFGSFQLPQPPGFIKTISGAVSSLHPVETIKSINPFKSIGSGGAKAAEKTVKNMFVSFQSLDFDGAEKYVDISALKIPDDYISIIDTDALMRATFDKLEYEITSKADKISDAEFEVTVNVTAVNVKRLMAGLVQGYAQFEFDAIRAGVQLSQNDKDQKIAELLAGFVTDEDTGTVSNEVTLNVSREDNAWRVIPDNDLINALFGGVIATAGDFFAPDDPTPGDSAGGASGTEGIGE